MYLVGLYIYIYIYYKLFNDPTQTSIHGLMKQSETECITPNDFHLASPSPALCSVKMSARLVYCVDRQFCSEHSQYNSLSTSRQAGNLTRQETKFSVEM